LEINSLPGSYAVRLRNSDQLEWGDWINIEEGLYYSTGTPIGDDALYDAYSIDNGRIIVPWDVGKINGVRRVCGQILTLYGISRTFCVEVFVNVDILQYTFKFYKTDDRTEELPTYNGFPVLSLSKNESTFSESNPTTIHFSVIFSDSQSYAINDLKYNVIQNGVEDVFDQSFESKSSDGRIFNGSFKIYKDDGVFNKDGKGFIQVIFPSNATSSSYGSDTSDIYNMILNDKDLAKYNNLNPEEIYQQTLTDRIEKTLSLNSFKQYYDIDDPNFLFGNPDYFKTD
jgi:hypothetical protein